MRITRIALVSVALASLVVSAAAHAAARTARVRYAEPVTLKGLPSLPAAGAQKPAGPARTGFDAFGRRFELALESNDRVIRKLSSADRGLLPAHALYSGTVAGLPGSWVRLTRLDDGIHGLVFDGTDLYVLAPAGQTQAQLDTPLPGLAKTATLIYRAADADSGLGPDFCRVLRPPSGDGGATGDAPAEPAYKAIFAELKSNADAIAAALPTRELDLALVGDTQLAATYANAPGEMLARLNNIDGIFSSQVGVKVTSGFVKVLTDNGGMVSTVADMLLDQFESYRKSTPQAASRGLSHLMTGRDLDGSTIGIAYLGTLCASQFAVSLSQTYSDSFTSSLVAAHEVGHNFGAPHDGVSGSSCTTTPQTYLMSPTINGSSTFSQCSLDQMAPKVNAATCLTAPTFADVAVEFASASIPAYTKQDLHVPVDVVSGGNLGIDQAVLTLSTSGSMAIRGASVPGGTCATEGSTWTCQLGTLAAGTRRQVDVVVRGDFISAATLLASVQARADTVPTNNDVSVQVVFSSPADGSLALSSSSLSAYVGQAQEFSITASNAGPLALENASVVMQNPGLFNVASAGGAGVSCTTTPAEISCTVGTIPPGESRRIDISLVGTRAWGNTVPVSIRSANDDVHSNDQVYLTIKALPLVELTLTAEPGPTLIKIGGTITQSFTLRSAGPQPVDGASLTLQPSQEMEIVAVTGADAVCGPTGDAQRSWLCTYAAPIEPGGSRRLDATLMGLSSLSGVLIASAGAPDSQHLDAGRDLAVLRYDLRSDVDVRLYALFSGAEIYDHRAATLTFDVDSIGLTPATNSRFTLSLPANLRATKAQATVGSCSISTSSVDCPLGTLAFSAASRIRVDVVSDVTGSVTVNAQASADADADSSNGSAQVRLDVRPNINLSLAPLPSVTRVRAGATIDYPVTVTAASQPVPGAVVAFSLNSGITAVGATPSQGSCETTSSFFLCTLGTVPANGTATVTLRLRGDNVASVVLGVNATGTGDNDPGDGRSSGSIVVDARGNVAVQSAAANASATVGTAFEYPRITITAITATDDVRVGITVPAAFSIDSATADNAPCSVNAGSVSCSFGTLDAGASRGISIQLRPNQSGRFAVSVNATAVDDSDTSNNSGSVSITVTKAASSGGGGGGGGALDRESLLMLLLLAPAVARRRRTGAD